MSVMCLIRHVREYEAPIDEAMAANVRAWDRSILSAVRLTAEQRLRVRAEDDDPGRCARSNAGICASQSRVGASASKSGSTALCSCHNPRQVHAAAAVPKAVHTQHRAAGVPAVAPAVHAAPGAAAVAPAAHATPGVPAVAPAAHATAGVPAVAPAVHAPAAATAVPAVAPAPHTTAGVPAVS